MMKSKVVHTCDGCYHFYDDDELLGIKNKTVPSPTRHCDYTDKFECEYFSGKAYDKESEDK